MDKKQPGPKKDKPKNIGEDLLFFQITSAGLPVPERELRFHPNRKWRFDFAWPEHALAAEVEGGSWSGGRHTTGKGFEADCEKYSVAAALGWRVVRATTSQVKSGEALTWVIGALGREFD